MAHRVLSAVEALQLKVTQEVSHGTSCAQQRAQQVAHAQTVFPSMVRPPASPGILVREAVGHAECRLINGGEAKSTLHVTGIISHDMRWSKQREAPPLLRRSVHQTRSLLIFDLGGQFDGLQQSVLLNTMQAAHEQLRISALPTILSLIHISEPTRR